MRWPCCAANSIRMDLSGHTTTAINRKYSHAKVEDLRKAVHKIGGKEAP